jgi:hypothetical protein
MKHVEIQVKSESQPLVVEVNDHFSPESWLRSAGKYILLNGTSYRRDDIISVSSVLRHRPRHGFTSMEGI